MKKVYLGLGTNLGDREKNLEVAISEISSLPEVSKISKKSSIYQSPPMYVKDQGDFLNMAVEIETAMEPIELIVQLLEIEHKMGRVREMKNGPRVIDLDILIYEDLILDDPSLQIPHPKLHKRSFVLYPLLEVAGEDMIHPRLQRPLGEFRSGVENQKINKF